MAGSRKDLLNFLNNTQAFSEIQSVEKAEISLRCQCVIKCAEIINSNDSVGSFLYILHHTLIGKKVLSLILNDLQSLFFFF
jgi:hypothetical protein